MKKQFKVDISYVDDELFLKASQKGDLTVEEMMTIILVLIQALRVYVPTWRIGYTILKDLLTFRYKEIE